MAGEGVGSQEAADKANDVGKRLTENDSRPRPRGPENRDAS